PGRSSRVFRPEVGQPYRYHLQVQLVPAAGLAGHVEAEIRRVWTESGGISGRTPAGSHRRAFLERSNQPRTVRHRTPLASLLPVVAGGVLSLPDHGPGGTPAERRKRPFVSEGEDR